MGHVDSDLADLTRKTAEMLFGQPTEEARKNGAFALWKEFDPALAREISMFYTGRLYARDVISQKQREPAVIVVFGGRW